MYELLTPPSDEPFTLTDLKEALRIDHDTDDALVSRLGTTARAFIERRLGHAVLAQTWQLTCEGQPAGPLTLRPGLVTEITGAEVRYGDGDWEATGDVRLVRSQPARAESSVPTIKDGEPLTGIRIQFTAGRASAANVPPELVQAILMLAAHYYEHREAVTEGRYVALPAGVESLLQAFREVQL